MKIYFVRHAPTQCNLTGTMVNAYENSHILNIKPMNWEEKVGQYIPMDARKVVLSSPARRCVETGELLFGRMPSSVSKCLGEFDCKALGNRKFWEITKDEFETMVKITPTQMAEKIRAILKVCRDTKTDYKSDSMVCISHGMVIRYLWHYFNGHPDASAFDIINSRGFKFSNLDLLILDTNKGTCEVHNFKEPIKHGE